MTKQVNNLGEALSVFVQIAELAQSKGILTFDDATIAKSAIDFVNELSAQAAAAQGTTTENLEGPQGSNTTTKSKRTKETATSTTEG